MNYLSWSSSNDKILFSITRIDMNVLNLRSNLFLSSKLTCHTVVKLLQNDTIFQNVTKKKKMQMSKRATNKKNKNENSERSVKMSFESENQKIVRDADRSLCESRKSCNKKCARPTNYTLKTDFILGGPTNSSIMHIGCSFLFLTHRFHLNSGKKSRYIFLFDSTVDDIHNNKSQCM